MRTVTGLDARLDLVRIGPGGGWRVEVGSAAASVTNPDLRIAALRGWAEDRGDGTLRFDLAELRTGRSRLAGAGSVRTGGKEPLYDLRLRADPLDFRDLQGMGIALPTEGTARFTLDVDSRPGGRTALAFTDARVAVLDSRASGRVTVLLSPKGDPTFSDTRLVLEPLQLADLEALGYAEDLPVGGEVRGTVSSPDELRPGEGGALRVDLAAALTPRGEPGAEPSRLTARGNVRFGRGPDALRLDGVRVEAEPLHLALLRSLSPANASYLRGTLRGGATVNGTLRAFRFAGGDLTYEVGDAPPTVLRGIEGRVALQPRLALTLSARAEPLALATLTELFPALPFRAATLSGPIRVTAEGDLVRFGVDLDGAAGGVEAEGTLTLGATPVFDVRGQLEAFRAGAVLATDTSPLEGPLNGTFSARGSTADFRFDVDLAQGEGRMVLGGNVRRAGPRAPYRFDVAGRVENFRIGNLVGRPGLLPGPVTGPIRLSGGGGDPYRFDVDLRGELGVLDVEGWYLPGTVPAYAFNGTISGLDLSSLPGLDMLPQTRLTGTLVLEGRGTTPETFDGRLEFNAARGSTVGGLPVETGLARIEGRNGVLEVDTLLLAVRGARLEASGALGLNGPVEARPLRFELSAPDLTVMAALVPPPGPLEPDMTGSLAASGVVVGTLRNPSLAMRATGRGLRFRGYAAATLDVDVRGRRDPAGWTGNARVEGTGLDLGDLGDLEALTLEANVTPQLASFGVAARRDPETELNASGTLELDGLAVRGVILDSGRLRLAGTEWTLLERARLSWTGDRGTVIENLALVSSGGGRIEADGALPRRGTADLRVRVVDMDLAEVRRLVTTLPEDVGGTLFLDLAVTGAVENPQLTVQARVDSLRWAGVTTDLLSLSARYDAGQAAADADVRLGGRQVLLARGTIPLRLDLSGDIPSFELLREGPLQATVQADSLPLALVATAFPQQLADGEGVARARIELSGTMADPEVRGEAVLAGGAVKVVPLGVRWRDITGRLSMEGDLVRIDTLSARTGDNGWARVTGTMNLEDGQAPVVFLTLQAESFQAISKEDVAELELDTDGVNVSGTLPDAVVTGSFTLEDGTIHIPRFGEEREADIVDAEVGEIGADTVSTALAGGAGALLGALVPRDLEVVIGERVWLESEDARIQITGRLGVNRGIGGGVVLTGDLEAERGTFTVSIGGVITREFEIQSGRVQFFGTPDLNPALDIVATHEVSAREAGESPFDVQVRLVGTLQNPRVELSANSRVPIPESELVSLLLFGRRSTELAALPTELLEGAFLDEVLSGLFTGQIERGLTRTGLVDYVRVRAQPTGAGLGAFTSLGESGFLAAISVEIGKELADNIFFALQVAQVTSDPKLGATLDWEITRTWSLRAAIEPVRRDPLLRNFEDIPYNATVELRRRWEYGRPPPVGDPAAPRPPTEEPRPAQPSNPTNEPRPPPPP
ncbi:MAG TPA: translocation/assembly module TamB domain-containing protein [Longimicrobiaceae bacterium]|nr:translocation/assembly module TamB domain-containing protein [Longimicrobiaceae bacterium]